MTVKLYIENYLPEKDDLLLEAMAHPTLKPKRKPTSELAHKAVLIVVEREVRKAIGDEIEALLDEAYGMYEINYGEHAGIEQEIQDGAMSSENLGEWESGLDDMVEALLEPYQEYLSANWLGVNTIGVRLWDEDAIPKFAVEVGKEVYKQLTYGKTPPQALANAGITSPEVELYFAQHMEQNSEEDDTPMSVETSTDLASVINKIAVYVGKTYNPVDIYEAFEDAVDDDDILADGAGKRVGLEHSDIIVLQLFTMDAQTDDPAEELTAMVTAAVAVLNAGKPKTKPKAQPKPENAPTGDVLDARVFELIGKHSAAKDTEFAKDIGVSRSSLGNYRAGTSAFAPTDDQRAAIRQQIVADTNGLLEALALVDGTAPMAVS